jgi:hypothetical protein
MSAPVARVPGAVERGEEVRADVKALKRVDGHDNFVPQPAAWACLSETLETYKMDGQCGGSGADRHSHHGSGRSGTM